VDTAQNMQHSRSSHWYRLGCDNTCQWARGSRCFEEYWWLQNFKFNSWGWRHNTTFKRQNV